MKTGLFSFFLFTALSINAQFSDQLSSDRPGQAFSSSVVGTHVFQIQTGIDFFDNSSQANPSSYFRYGLSERFELNTGFLLAGDVFASEIASFLVGARVRLNRLDSKFNAALQISYDFGLTNKSAQITYIFGGQFTEKLSFTSNLGVNIDNDIRLKNALYVFNLTYSLGSKTGVFVESFGSFLNDTDQINVDSGWYYLLDNNFQLDAVFGYNDGVFVGAGFTWRIHKKN